ncbi:hypothetical protein AB1Y20_022900 [Prymnesium parvum]|uniref:Uncharacterized protein n=1 Tax=Prymnesium parvum TaxID=97485 RepID=A0AB34JC75_PRYPA
MADPLALQIVAAIEALSSEQGARANAWLMALSQDPAAPSACFTLLQSSSSLEVPEAALLVAARLVASAPHQPSEAAHRQAQLIELCATVPSRPAAAHLAAAAASLATASKSEDSLLDSALFASLDLARKLLVLRSLADSLGACGSAEELSARPSARAASHRAVSLLEAVVLHPHHLPTLTEALVCLAAWADCGLLSFEALALAHRSLLDALLAALVAPLAVGLDTGGAGLPADRLRVAALAAAAIHACVVCSSELGDEVDLAIGAGVLQALDALSAHVTSLGAPRLDADGTTDGGAASGGDVAAWLASELAGLATRTIELLIDGLVEHKLMPSSGTKGKMAGGEACSDETRGHELAEAVRGVVALALSALLHPVGPVAETAASGWNRILEALPPSVCCSPVDADVHAWRIPVFIAVAQNVITRSSYAQLRRGAGDDVEDVHAYRERSSSPLLRDLSVELGLDWVLTISRSLEQARVQVTLRSDTYFNIVLVLGRRFHLFQDVAPLTTPLLLKQALIGFPSGEAQLEAVESLLAALACTSPRCMSVRRQQGLNEDQKRSHLERLFLMVSLAEKQAGDTLSPIEASVLTRSAHGAMEAMQNLQRSVE